MIFVSYNQIQPFALVSKNLVQTYFDIWKYFVLDLIDDKFDVRTNDLIRLCVALLNGTITLQSLTNLNKKQIYTIKWHKAHQWSEWRSGTAFEWKKIRV